MLLSLLILPVSAARVGATAGLVAGGPGVGATLFVDHARQHLYVGADLTVAVHDRSYGTASPVIVLPSVLVAVPFGDEIGVGPAVRLDTLVGGRDEQYASTGFGTRFAAVIDDPFVVVGYPSAGVALRATGEQGSELVASLTFGLPFSSFDLYLPTAPTPAVAWTQPSGWRLGARATRYQATFEVGHAL